MRTLDEVLGVLRAQGAQAHYGRAFEVLVKNLLRGLPIWKNTFREVGLWGDYALGQDIGIDLVAEDMEGRLYGIQAKFYEPGHSVAKADIDSFLAALGGEILFKGKPRTFEGGMIFATTDDFGANADALLAAWGDRVQVFNRSWLESLDGVNWERLAGLSDIGPVVAEKPLRDYQLEAIAAAKKYYAPLPDGTLSHTRGKLIMACGTGKTLTSLRMLEQCTGGGALLSSSLCPPLRCSIKRWWRGAMMPSRISRPSVFAPTLRLTSAQRRKRTHRMQTPTVWPCRQSPMPRLWQTASEKCARLGPMR